MDFSNDSAVSTSEATALIWSKELAVLPPLHFVCTDVTNVSLWERKFTRQYY